MKTSNPLTTSLRVAVTATPVFLLLSALAQQPNPGEPATAKKQELRALGALPDDRKFELPDKNERNPFLSPSVKSKQPETVTTDSEDARILAVLKQKKITGLISDSQGGFKVQFGRASLKEGDELPTLIQGQTARLRVSKLTDKVLEVSWIEKDPNVRPLVVPLPINIGTGAVRQMLAEGVMELKYLNGETQPEAAVGTEGTAGEEAASLEQEAFRDRQPGRPNARTLSNQPR